VITNTTIDWQSHLPRRCLSLLRLKFSQAWQRTRSVSLKSFFFFKIIYNPLGVHYFPVEWLSANWVAFPHS
jgi:hypothetical protein